MDSASGHRREKGDGVSVAESCSLAGELVVDRDLHLLKPQREVVFLAERLVESRRIGRLLCQMPGFFCFSSQVCELCEVE